MLGGHDWDLRMADFAADAFQKQHGLDPRKDPAAMNRTLAAVIEAKHTLSARVRAMIRVEMAGQIERSARHARAVRGNDRRPARTHLLHHAAIAGRRRLEWKDIDRLLLVGGSTRMPMVVDMLRQLSGLEPDHTVNPDEAVARGAALYAGYLLAKEGGGGHETTVPNHERQFAQPGRGRDRSRNAAEEKRGPHSPQHAAAGQKDRAFHDQIGRPALDRAASARRREHDSRRMHDHRADRDPRPARRIDQRLADRRHLRIRQQRPVERPCGGAGHAATKRRWIWSGPSGMSREGIEHWKQPIGAAAGFDSFESMVQDVLGLDAPLAAVGTSPRSAARGRAPARARLAAEPSEIGNPLCRDGSAGASPLPRHAAASIRTALPATSPADSLIPQRKPGASASRTFAAKPQSLAEASPLWEEEEDIPAG